MRSLSLALLFLLGAAAQGAQVTFHPLSLGAEGDLGVFSEDLDGDGHRDIIALSLGRIAVFRANPKNPSGYSAAPETLVTNSMAYYADVADVLPDKGKEVLILTPDGIFCFVQENGRFNANPRPLLKRDTILSLAPLRAGDPRPVLVIPWNFALDLNGDGLDDLVVPHAGGTDVYLQTKLGELAKPFTLPLPPVVVHFGPQAHRPDELRGRIARSVNVNICSPSIEARDANKDGKPDIVHGPFFFPQKADGAFDTVPQRLPQDPEPPEQAEGPVKVRRLDINGDGQNDTLVEETNPEDILNLQTIVRVFLRDKNGNLPEDPSHVIKSQNILIHTFLPIYDFDKDGTLDIAMLKTDITPTEIGRWIRMNLGKIDGDLNFYLFDRRAGRHLPRPTFTKPIKMRFKVELMEAIMGLVWETYMRTMVRFEGDYNGDGFRDLLVREETDRIALYFNTGKPKELYADEPSVNLDLKGLPTTFYGLDLFDLNGDGADDLILYGPNPNRVLAIFVSRKQ